MAGFAIETTTRPRFQKNGAQLSLTKQCQQLSYLAGGLMIALLCLLSVLLQLLPDILGEAHKELAFAGLNTVIEQW